MSTLKKLYNEKIKAELKNELGLDNVMEVPKLTKIVINRGLGEAIVNAKALEISLDTMYAITGQKPLPAKAKKSVSNFKIREGQVIGAKVTLRSDKMYDFLTKFIKLALPRIRDFRGVPSNGFDGQGNYTLGIKEDTIFPETPQDKLDKIRGFDITFVSTANDDKGMYELLKAFGMPFRTPLKVKKG